MKVRMGTKRKKKDSGSSEVICTFDFPLLSYLCKPRRATTFGTA